MLKIDKRNGTVNPPLLIQFDQVEVVWDDVRRLAWSMQNSAVRVESMSVGSADVICTVEPEPVILSLTSSAEHPQLNIVSGWSSPNFKLQDDFSRLEPAVFSSFLQVQTL